MVAPQPPWPPWSPTPQCEQSWPPWNSALQSSGVFWRRLRKVLCLSHLALLLCSTSSKRCSSVSRSHHTFPLQVPQPPHVLSFVKTMFPPPLIFRGHTCEGPRNTAVSAHTLWATTPHPADADLRHVCNNKNGEGACPLPGPLKILQFKGRKGIWLLILPEPWGNQSSWITNVNLWFWTGFLNFIKLN